MRAEFIKCQVPPATPWDHNFTGFPDGKCALIPQVKPLTHCTPSSWLLISGSLIQTSNLLLNELQTARHHKLFPLSKVSCSVMNTQTTGSGEGLAEFIYPFK